MLRKKILPLFIAGVFSFNISGQTNEDTIVKIGDKEYSVDEFEFIYNKNNSFSEAPKSKKDYIDLFVNYKLKVLAAEDQGLDTLPSFKKEFNYYKNELAKPYLSDKTITKKIMDEAYDRLKTEVNASHILIKLPPSPTPEDTLKAYNKIKEIREKAINGESFAKLATQYSEDPSAKSNAGKLGYFSGFMMVYPFENAAYNTPVGEISDIVRSNFGYHILKIHDKRPNPGEVHTAHIMKIFPPGASQKIIDSLKNAIDSIYIEVKAGKDFGELAKKYSDDKNSAVNNGELPWFGSGRMIPEFSEPAFKLKNEGDISEVIRTPYGFHIIKLLGKRGVKSYEELEDEIKSKISRDERAYQGKKAVINRLKKEYNLTENEDQIKELRDKALDTELNDNDYFQQFSNNGNEIISFKDNKFTTSDFINYLKSNRQFSGMRRGTIFDRLLSDFIDTKLLDYEKEQLPNKYPEYRHLLQEYYDGLLIFDISQKEIWDKAVNDSIGTEKYYNEHKNKYIDPEKYDGTIFWCKTKKDLKTVSGLCKKNASLTTDSIDKIITSNNIDFNAENGVFTKGQYSCIDKQIWHIKKSDGEANKDYPYGYAVGKVIPEKQLKFAEIKGQVIADYQTEIENQWIKKLKEQYKPEIFAKALKKVKSK